MSESALGGCRSFLSNRLDKSDASVQIKKDLAMLEKEKKDKVRHRGLVSFVNKSNSIALMT